jgi:hypothetical protein
MEATYSLLWNETGMPLMANVVTSPAVAILLPNSAGHVSSSAAHGRTQGPTSTNQAHGHTHTHIHTQTHTHRYSHDIHRHISRSVS